MAKWEEFSGSIEKSRIYHERYHKAVSNPVRKSILKMIAEGKNEEEIVEKLGISKKELEYHLRMLEWGFCIERTEEGWKITKEGEIIDYL
ncbi:MULTISPECIES: winged helix-turn-helix domain-containing protein [unclassified Archaeoglobus]|jgi:predicted transcriptional regulator|uniref:winged helix-turn-helix domain-containing protein n=1 Tax=unclassified Archaeoglobus TaxID=2643606 RepID=UPI0025BE2FAC|nr:MULTISPECIES: helix-turn-helix domain-containing protein [unclassified Archaeoglobus]